DRHRPRAPAPGGLSGLGRAPAAVCADGRGGAIRPGAGEAASGAGTLAAAGLEDRADHLLWEALPGGPRLGRRTGRAGVRGPDDGVGDGEPGRPGVAPPCGGADQHRTDHPTAGVSTPPPRAPEAAAQPGCATLTLTLQRVTRAAALQKRQAAGPA